MDTAKGPADVVRSMYQKASSLPVGYRIIWVIGTLAIGLISFTILIMIPCILVPSMALWTVLIVRLAGVENAAGEEGASPSSPKRRDTFTANPFRTSGTSRKKNPMMYMAHEIDYVDDEEAKDEGEDLERVLSSPRSTSGFAYQRFSSEDMEGDD